VRALVEQAGDVAVKQIAPLLQLLQNALERGAAAAQVDRLLVDAAIGEASCDVTIVCSDGRRLHTFVQHAIGSLERPMPDAGLERKFHDLVDPILGAARAGELIGQCAAFSRCADVRSFLETTHA